VVPGVKPVAVWEKAVALVPLPMLTAPPLAGTRVPKVSLHVAPGFVAAKRYQPVVATPFGFAVPVKVTAVLAKLVAPVVTTVGGAGV
jgi:hypothetical protein